MPDINQLFAKAHELHVVDEKHREAIELCREVLTLAPDHHMARMLLAGLLDEHGNSEEMSESRQHYIEAIRRLPDLEVSRNGWTEESPVHQLAIWEERNQHQWRACLLYLLDFLLSENSDSRDNLMEVLLTLDKEFAEDIELVLSKAKNGVTHEK